MCRTGGRYIPQLLSVYTSIYMHMRICARMKGGVMIAAADCTNHGGALAIATVVAEGGAAKTDDNSIGRAGGVRVAWRLAAFAFAWWHECELTSGRPTTTAATTAPTATWVGIETWRGRWRRTTSPTARRSRRRQGGEGHGIRGVSDVRHTVLGSYLRDIILVVGCEGLMASA